jgi:hypothetical protein
MCSPYVALSRDARMSRRDLIETFWPGVNRAVVTGPANDVEPHTPRDLSGGAVGRSRALFPNGGRGADRPANGLRRCAPLCGPYRRGACGEGADRIDAARQHYRIAQRIYADRLLASEAREECFERLADGFEKLFVSVLRRLIELYTANGEDSNASEAARALRACNCVEARTSAYHAITNLIGASA